jgi:hypothetical protein
VRGGIGGTWGVRAKPAAVLLAIFLLAPSMTVGKASDFIPTIYYTGGTFDVAVIQQHTENTSGGGGKASSDLFASERLRLYLNGFIFHPRFIQFLFTGSGGLSQERSERPITGSSSENSVGTEYDFRTKILPEHPYNLELYTLRSTPLLRGQATAELRYTHTEQGAILNYARRPAYFNISYSTGENEARISSTEYTTARFRGSYFTGPFNNSCILAHGLFHLVGYAGRLRFFIVSEHRCGARHFSQQRGPAETVAAKLTLFPRAQYRCSFLVGIFYSPSPMEFFHDGFL